MHFDDRLATVLRNRAESGALARIQFRQLIDLIGSLGSGARSAQLDSAYVRLGELATVIPAGARAAILAEPGIRLRNVRLVATLAGGEQQVAAAAIGKAQLSGEEWLDLIPALPLHARALIRNRRDLGPEADARIARLGIAGIALPPAEVPGHEPAVEAKQKRASPKADAPEPKDEAGGIRALVNRIEEFRRARRLAEDVPPGDSPRLPLGDAEGGGAEPPCAFDFTTDAEGRINWASAGMAPMAVGLRLGGSDGLGGVSAAPALAAALRRRQPLRGQKVEIAGAPAIAGTWRIDMTPRFDPAGGRFTGFAGRLRRPATAPAAAPRPAEASEGDRIRQLLHELRTPVNAIQGFAEVIQQQLFGPTPHEYRALAAGIAGDAARILAGFEELERLAKLETGAQEIEAGTCDLAEVLRTTIAHLDAYTAPRGCTLHLKLKDEPLPVALARAEAERLVWRLLATLAAGSAPGETVDLRARWHDGRVRLKIALPESLAAREGDELFRAAAPQAQALLSAGMFGTGFALRLARAEARAAGGSLERRGQSLRLELPGLTGGDAANSQEAA